MNPKLFTSLALFLCSAQSDRLHAKPHSPVFPQPFHNTLNEIAAMDDEESSQDDESMELKKLSEDDNRYMNPPLKKKYRLHCKHFRVNVAPEYSYMIWRSKEMRAQRGNLGGISGEIEYKKREHVYADASFLWNQGAIHAHGHRSHSWKEAVAQGMVGYTLGITDHFCTTPYVGFGYRKVMHHKGFQNTTTLNYYQYFIPFGVLMDYCCAPKFTVSLNLKALPAVDSRVYFTNTPNVFWKLKNKGNYEIDLPIKWTAAKTQYLNFDLTLVPFFKYWVLGPNSKRHMHSQTQSYWGVELQLGFTL